MKNQAKKGRRLEIAGAIAAYVISIIALFFSGVYTASILIMQELAALQGLDPSIVLSSSMQA